MCSITHFVDKYSMRATSIRLWHKQGIFCPPMKR
jgi:hypothetical protein